jgi:RND family efflux transporter MFP subunit
MKQFHILALALVMILIGCSNGKKQEKVLEKKPITVKVIEVGRGEFSKFIQYKGTVSPWKTAHIAPDASGRIGKIYKKQGDRVKAGDLLAELDTTTLRLQLKQTQAALEVANAAFKDAKLNSSRLEKLREKNAISQMQLEKAQLGLESAATQLKSAEANLNLVKHTLDNSIMKAPFSGIITSKNLEEGDMINPMMGMGASVLTLMDLSRVKVVLDIPSEDIEKIKINQSCQIKVIGLGERVFNGEIYSKNWAADPLSKTFKVEVKIENPDIKIKAGVFAEVMIRIFHKMDVMTIPLSALVDDQYVVLFEEGKARTVTVKAGDKNNREVEIISGLNVGQLVVIEGNYDLKDGSLIVLEGADK